MHIFVNQDSSGDVITILKPSYFIATKVQPAAMLNLLILFKSSISMLKIFSMF